MAHLDHGVHVKPDEHYYILHQYTRVLEVTIRVTIICLQDNESASLDRHLHLLLHLRPVRTSPAHGPEYTALFLQ